MLREVQVCGVHCHVLGYIFVKKVSVGIQSTGWSQTDVPSGPALGRMYVLCCPGTAPSCETGSEGTAFVGLM